MQIILSVRFILIITNLASSEANKAAENQEIEPNSQLFLTEMQNQGLDTNGVTLPMNKQSLLNMLVLLEEKYVRLLSAFVHRNLVLINQNQEAEKTLEDVNMHLHNNIREKMKDVKKNEDNIDFLLNKLQMAKTNNKAFEANLNENKEDENTSKPVNPKVTIGKQSL